MLKGKEDPEYVILARLYLLSKEVEDDTFGDTVINAFLAKIRERTMLPDLALLNLPGPWCINLTYRKTKTGDLLRKVLVHAYAREDSMAILKNISSHADLSFHSDLSVELLEMRAELTTTMDEMSNCELSQSSNVGIGILLPGKMVFRGVRPRRI
jgi:hypothetical protein